MTRLSTIFAKIFVVFTAGCLLSSAGAGELKGKVSGQGVRSAEDVVVYIDASAGQSFPKPTQHVVMDQIHLAFEPHVLPVLVGTTVDLKNDDAVGHNVFWPAINHNKKLAANLGTWPQGQIKSYTFNDPGDVPLLCNVHPEMSGYVFVVPTPYFALTDKAGNFTMKNVPPGQYTLKSWSEQAKPSSQAITVGSGSENVDVIVKK